MAFHLSQSKIHRITVTDNPYKSLQQCFSINHCLLQCIPLTPETPSFCLCYLFDLISYDFPLFLLHPSHTGHLVVPCSHSLFVLLAPLPQGSTHVMGSFIAFRSLLNGNLISEAFSDTLKKYSWHPAPTALVFLSPFPSFIFLHITYYPLTYYALVYFLSATPNLNVSSLRARALWSSLLYPQHNVWQIVALNIYLLN